MLNVLKIWVRSERLDGLNAQQEEDPDTCAMSATACIKLFLVLLPGSENSSIVSQDDHVHNQVKCCWQCRKSYAFVSFEDFCWCSILHSRPRKKAAVFNVPCSASKRSIKGVRHTTFSSMCKKPVCIKGKVLSRYTARTKSISIVLRSEGTAPLYLDTHWFRGRSHSVSKSPIVSRSTLSVIQRPRRRQ